MRFFQALILSLVLASPAVLAQQDEPHAGQPATCNNMKGATHPCDCARAMSCPGPDEPEDMHCQTYCRKEACNCIAACALD